MDSEMFAQLLEMVSQAGEGGFALAMVYLLKGYFITAVWVGSLVFIILKAFRFIVSFNRVHKTLQVVSKMVTGHEWYMGLSMNEADEIIREVRRLKNDK